MQKVIFFLTHVFIKLTEMIQCVTFYDLAVSLDGITEGRKQYKKRRSPLKKVL